MRPDPLTVCDEYDPLIKWVAGRYYRRYAGAVDLDDIRQAVRVGFWRAAQTYDPARGDFRSYARLEARKPVRRVAAAALSRGLAWGRGGPRKKADPPAVEALCESHERRLASPEAAGPAGSEPLDPAALWARVRAVLPPADADLVERWCRGERLPAIGHSAVGTRSAAAAARWRVRRAVEKLRAAMSL